MKHAYTLPEHPDLRESHRCIERARDQLGQAIAHASPEFAPRLRVLDRLLDGVADEIRCRLERREARHVL